METGRRELKKQVWRDYFRLGGGLGASRDMNVDGSISPVFFEIRSPSIELGYDIYVSYISIRMIDSGITKNNFGGAQGELTNGFILEYHREEGYDSENQITEIIPASVSWGEFDVENAFGPLSVISFASGQHVNGPTAATILSRIELRPNLRDGVKLKRGKNDFFRIIIQDDISGADQFIAHGTGYKL